ncbi:RraA family protein [Paraburkholderia sp.]|uniref:RraA family protein n=1 Tax=Paraburkholderia sp. TaxID=1926495 RepID=UPI0039E3FEE0
MTSDYFGTIKNRLSTTLIGDVMESLGFRNRFLPPSIRSSERHKIVVGRAMPVQMMNTDEGNFDVMLKAIEDLKPGEVYLCTGGSPNYALWGDLMSTRARALGATGAVLEGFHRDSTKIGEIDLPVFSMGGYGQTSKGRGAAVNFRCDVVFSNGVKVSPGDFVVGDDDGVLIIPQAHIKDIARKAIEKADEEELARTRVQAGKMIHPEA